MSGSTRAAIAALAALMLGLPGCAAFRSYDKSLSQSVEQVASGNVDGAIKSLDAANSGSKKDLLYYLELGMLQRLGGRTAESQKAWGVAQAFALPDQSKGAGQQVSDMLANASSYLVNDRLRPYAGHDYEKTLLLTHRALNLLALGDLEQA